MKRRAWTWAVVILAGLWLGHGLDGVTAAGPSALQSSESGQAQAFPIGEVLAIREVTLADDSSAAELERFFTKELEPKWQKNVPDIQALLMKGDRGARDGKLLSIWNFPTVESRDRYFPSAGEDAYPVFQKAIEPMSATLDKYNSYLSADSSGPDYTDYVLIGADELKGLPDIQLLGLHTIKVKPGKEKAFESFVKARWNPAWAEHVPGCRTLIFKGDRGANEGGHLLVFTFNPAELRDKYVPDGQPSNEYSEAAQPLEPLWEEFNGYLDVTLGSPGHSFTDYVLVR